MSTQTTENTVSALVCLLEEIEERAGAAFSGVGVIITTDPSLLPVIPLRPTSTVSNMEPAAGVLARISNPQNEHHDGFHVLTTNFRILRVAQYFSPPIRHEVIIDRRKRFGGRYLAALFGSAIPGVIATGIASRDFGIAVFEQGRERLHRVGKL